MPLMRIRSVEIVFEDELSACTDTGILDRSIEMLASSDDSTECVDHLHVEREYDSVTLNADGDLSEDEDESVSPKDGRDSPHLLEIDDGVHAHTESLTLPHSCDATLSPNASEIGDSGRFTEDASSSHFETVGIAYDDALLSQSFDAINVAASATVAAYEIDEACASDRPRLLYEYIGSESDSSDDTATCDADLSKHAASDDHVDGFDQYDSFVDMGKF